MSKFSTKVISELSKCKYVRKVSATQVLFTPDFKILAVKLNLEGLSPADIFNQHGINTALFLEDYPKKSVTRWKKIYLELGEAGLREERRGKGATGRPRRTFDGTDVESLLRRVADLEMENFVLKKLKALADSYEKKKGSK